MSISAKIVADSVNPAGVRLTTIEVVFPRIILAEVNTHRVFSRNSASSRAIPIQKIIDRVLNHPFVPWYWGKNQKGMQAAEQLGQEESELAASIWLQARDDMVHRVRELVELGVHKQTANRLLEPFMWHTAIITSTEWSNWFHLRDSKQAQPEIEAIAHAMYVAMEDSMPVQKKLGEWHLPYVFIEDRLDNSISEQDLPKISAARCARVSVLTHDTGKMDRNADLGFYDRLLGPGHLSPFEHTAQAMNNFNFYGNLRGWKSLRKQIPNEWDILGERAS